MVQDYRSRRDPQSDENGGFGPCFSATFAWHPQLLGTQAITPSFVQATARYQKRYGSHRECRECRLDKA